MTLHKTGDVAQQLFGDNTAATRARIRRLVDAGELRAVRVGRRGDRLIPDSDVQRLLHATTVDCEATP